ncbi:MAG: MFS transporter, partial [Chloroflexi bacterium]|nr:MFS transporter [Chloroflexota bacterium]
MTSPRSWFYGWRVLLASSIMGSVGIGITISGFPVFFLRIREELNLSSTEVSFLIGFAWAQSGVVAPLMGWLADHIGPRKLVLAGGLTCGAGLILVSFADNIWQLLLFYGVVVAIGRTAAFNPTLMAPVNQWFVRRKAIAMSIQGTSFTAGAAVMIPLFALGADHIGWRHTILVAGVALSLLTLPVAYVIRNKPEDIGLLPDGDQPSQSLPPTDSAEQTSGAGDLLLGQALQTRAFWLLLTGLVLRVSVADAMLIHSIPLLVWKGIPEQSAAFFVSLVFLCMIPVRLTLGISGAFLPPYSILFCGMVSGGISVGVFLNMEGTAAAIPFIVALVSIEGVATLNWIAVGD